MDTLRKELKDAAEQYLFRLNEGRIFGAEFMRGDIKAAFEAGYHEAEKDLSLTWEDIDKIMQIEGYLNRYTKIPLEGRITFCGEVLRRFNEYKQKTK